jgi:protein mago nashi
VLDIAKDRISKSYEFALAVWIGQLVVQQIRQLVEESEIMKEDDAKWPKKNVVGRQELEIRIGNEHISFEVCIGHGLWGRSELIAAHLLQTAKLGSLVEVQDSDDPEGLRVFYYLVQDLKVCSYRLY